MELRVNEVQIPENITFNYEELKQELTKKVSMYETMVYTDDQIKEAKADKAQLNKLKKALNDERIRREKSTCSRSMNSRHRLMRLSASLTSLWR